jgi:hypothetical protein
VRSLTVTIHSVTSLKNLASPMERMQVAAVVSAHP